MTVLEAEVTDKRFVDSKNLRVIDLLPGGTIVQTSRHNYGENGAHNYCTEVFGEHEPLADLNLASFSLEESGRYHNFIAIYLLVKGILN